jgi:two-component system, LuxR family, sensor kinase FixL
MSKTTPADDLKALLDAAVDGIVLVDHSGIIQVFNRAAEGLFGLDAAEVLGRNVTVLMIEEDAGRHDEHLKEYLDTRVPRVIGRGREVIARRKDGGTFPAFLSVGVVEGSEPVRFVGFIQDLSIRRSAEEEARRLQERLWQVSRLATMGEMASGIAHELNQPLAAIANYSQACDRLLAQPDADIPEIREALREITGQAVRAGEIIRKLRGLATHSEGESEPTNINRLISELADLVRSSTKAHHIQCQLDLGHDLPDLKIQPAEIQQVILNLVRNAIESFAPSVSSARRIVIRTASTGEGDIEVSVCDNGPGVASHIAPSLFEPFCSSKDKSAGLGLAISRTIIARHGGTLRYHPNHPIGACFTVRLPCSCT